MPKITPEQKIQNARQRMLETAKQYQLGTYATKHVAKVFQQMIRAEAAAMPAGLTPAIFLCELSNVFRQVGQCVCITCGTVAAWKGNSIGGGEIETGHFIASRRVSILFDEDNVSPQCKICNRHRGGEQQLYRKWMEAVRGKEAIERLERLKNQSVVFSREELVDMKIAYAARLQAAETKMKGF